MIRKIKEAIEKDHLLKQGEKVVVAVSGGADSVALLRVLAMVADDYKISLIVAHVNHGLRENAGREEQFVRQMAGEMGFAFEGKSVDVRPMKKGTGRSIEEISREVRYNFLNHVAQKHGAQKIALGHNSNDQIETVLMNFLRGSGSAGLRGMLPSRDSVYIRPLLCVKRDELISFLQFHGVPFIIDESNKDPAYLRNRIRHSLIPELKARYNPNLEESLKSMVEIMRAEDDYMKGVTTEVLSEWCIGAAHGEISISIPKLVKYHSAIQRRIMKHLLEWLSGNRERIGSTHIKAALDLAYSEHPGAFVNLPCNVEARREYDILIMKNGKGERKIPSSGHASLEYEVRVPGSVAMTELEKTMIFKFVERPINIKANGGRVAFMDYERISAPLVIRTMRPGDRIQPLGMKGMKKIKSVFIDEKIPLRQRKSIPLLLDQESVLWIAGLKLSERVKITERTSHILKVEFV